MRQTMFSRPAHTARQTYLKLYNIWIEAEQKFAVYDYTEFIRTDYNRVCNSDGMCYVTEELRQFLQKFAENHSLWTDGIAPDSGTPEGKGYTANQDAIVAVLLAEFYEVKKSNARQTRFARIAKFSDGFNNE